MASLLGLTFNQSVNFPNPLPSTSDAVEKPRFSEVDSLRAVACICVIVYHSVWQFNKITESGTWLYDLLGNGELGVLGVMVFFAISGYVIPHSLRGARVVGAKRFIIRRFWRLYPPFWGVLLLACIAKFSTLWDGHFLWGLTMLPSAARVENALGHFWTLEVELLFYMLLAVLFLALGRLGLIRIVLTYSVILGVLWIWPALPMEKGLWRRLPLFFSIMIWGAACREIIRLDFSSWLRLGLPDGMMRAMVVGGFTGLLMAWPLCNIYFGFIDEDRELVRQFSVLSLSIIIFLFWVILRPMRIRCLARVGRWTYSVYLWHMMPIHAAVLSAQSGVFNGLRGWPLPIYIVVFLPLCFALGAAAYRWIEQPSDRIGKRIAG